MKEIIFEFGRPVLIALALIAPALAQTVMSVSESEHVNRAPPPPAATPNPNCTIIVPADPLSAAGLATPYQLTATDPTMGACHESNPAQSAFAQAAILDPARGTISIYNPLVIDRGTSPAAAPIAPSLPAGAIVGIWFGYNGTNLTLRAASGGRLASANCVNGLPGSVFTQFAYCNATAFFRAANAAIRNGVVVVPALGTASDGEACPSVRDFFIVDQDQSDNLPTMYLATANGQIAQDTAANRATLSPASVLGNPSDNRLTDLFVDAALKCRAWTAPDLADPGHEVPALALNELQARRFQQTPVALVPLGDPMTKDNASDSLSKVNLYRLGVDQPVVISSGDADTARYCRQILRIAPARLLLDESPLLATRSPDPAAANSLYTFMAQRLTATLQTLNCRALTRQPDPVSVVRDSTGVAISASIDQVRLNAIIQALAPLKAADDIADSTWRSR